MTRRPAWSGRCRARCARASRSLERCVRFLPVAAESEIVARIVVLGQREVGVGLHVGRAEVSCQRGSGV